MVRQWSRRFAATAIVIACAATAADAGDRRSVQITGGVRTYEVSAGDTWQRIASRFGVDVRTLVADNGLTMTRPLQPGQRLRVDNRHIIPDAAARRPIVVNVPQ